MRKIRKSLYVLIASAFLFALSAGCASSENPDTNYPDATTEVTTPPDAEHEVIDLDFDISPAAAICMDGFGNIWISDSINEMVWKINADREQVAFAEGIAVIDLSVKDGRVYMLGNQTVHIYDADGAELERHSLETEGGGFLEALDDADSLLITVGNNPPVYGILYDLDTETETVLLDAQVNIAYPLSDGRVLTATHMQGYYLAEPLKPQAGSIPYDPMKLSSFPKYDRYTGIFFAFAGDTLYAFESVTDEGLRLLAVDDPLVYDRFRIYTSANNQVAVLSGQKLYVFHVAELVEFAKTRKTLTIYGNLHPLIVEYIAQYRKNYPNIEIIHIEPQLIAGEWLYERFLLDLIGGSIKPDLLYFFNSNFHFPALELGLLRDLGEFPALREMMGSTELLDGLRDMCIDSDGALFGIPAFMRLPVTIANADLFEALGIPLPPWEWDLDDYFALGEMAFRGFDERGLPNVMFPVRSIEDGFPDAHIVSESNGYRPVFNTADYIEYARKSLYLSDLYGGGSRQYSSMDGWPKGNVLMNSVVIDDEMLWDKEGAFVVLPSPAFHINPSGLNLGYLGIPKTSDNPDMAVSFIAGFLDEGFHRANASYANLIYKDFSNYDRILNELAEPLERIAAEAIIRREKSIMIPQLNYWQRTELFPLYQSGELTLEQCAALLQQ